ncbi:hypothetical protein [Streptomyces sp. NPDC057582]|uniref:hypothetical protein n=1 Tax=Streptomyces sp. NPDC057582 TaxID=3346174 RepID=UPI0036892294
MDRDSRRTAVRLRLHDVLLHHENPLHHDILKAATGALLGVQRYTVFPISSMMSPPPIAPIFPIDPVSPVPPIRPVFARRADRAGRTGGTGATWRTGRADLDAVRLKVDVPCPHVVDLHLMGDKRARLRDKRGDQRGAKHEGAPLTQHFVYASHVIPHAT